MANSKFCSVLALFASLGLTGCGFNVPEMNALAPDTKDVGDPYSTQGRFENNLVGHIRCSIAKGLERAKWLEQTLEQEGAREGRPAKYIDWIYSNKWGTAVNLTLQVDELSGLNPNATTTNQFQNWVKGFPKNGNVTFPQLFSLGLAASGAAHSTRTKTIAFTYANADLLTNEEHAENADNGQGLNCARDMNGFQIQSDLKLDEFIWDEATVAAGGGATSYEQGNPYNTFQETLTFVVSLGGSVTPTWKITTLVVDPSSPLFTALRSETNTLVITMGPLAKPVKGTPLALQPTAQAQHVAQSIGVATSGQTKASQ